jgi:hypothetical protein
LDENYLLVPSLVASFYSDYDEKFSLTGIGNFFFPGMYDSHPRNLEELTEGR